MTERHLLLRAAPHLEDLVPAHPIEVSPEKVGAGCRAAATTLQTCGVVSSGEPEGC